MTGIDPYIEAGRRHPGGVEVLRRSLDEVDGRFDLVMFHHSLEHLPDPLAALRTAVGLLAPGGTILVRVPVAGAFGWRTWGTDWVALDAPRHLVIPTERAMDVLAERAGLLVFDSAYDSTAYSFYGSEQFRAGIPLADPRSSGRRPGCIDVQRSGHGGVPTARRRAQRGPGRRYGRVLPADQGRRAMTMSW